MPWVSCLQVGVMLDSRFPVKKHIHLISSSVAQHIGGLKKLVNFGGESKRQILTISSFLAWIVALFLVACSRYSHLKLLEKNFPALSMTSLSTICKILHHNLLHPLWSEFPSLFYLKSLERFFECC